MAKITSAHMPNFDYFYSIDILVIVIYGANWCKVSEAPQYNSNKFCEHVIVSWHVAHVSKYGFFSIELKSTKNNLFSISFSYTKKIVHLNSRFVVLQQQYCC